jgi:hypothetical protein
VFDPCSSTRDPALQEAARTLAKQCGYELSELPASREEAQCCGWGGQPYTADSVFLQELAENRVSQSDLPFITYCTNCRDILAGKKKECVHILDILFNLNQGDRRSPTISERQENRRSLQETLLVEYKPDAVARARTPCRELLIDDGLAQRMSRDLILEEDVSAVISYCETTGHRLERSGTHTFIGHLQRGYVTYWVEYRIVDKKYLIHKAYSHRMVLKE